MGASNSLGDKVAVVTGGTRGIGYAIAGALVAAGARVVVCARKAAEADDAARRLGGPDRAAGARCDVRDPAEVGALMETAVHRFGGLDILVNNAGVGGHGTVADQTPEAWRAIIDTNLTGVFHCCHAAIPRMRARGGGWIVNISSLAGKNAFPGAAAYCASKAGLNAFSEALMQEVRYDGIRVSYVMPGSVRTAFGGHDARSDTDWMLDPADVAQVVLDLIAHDPRSLPSRVEIRPSQPKRR